MTNLSDYVGQSHETALIGEREPITLPTTVQIIPQRIILTLGNVNMYMSTDSAITLSDILVEGAISHMGVEFDEDFTQ